MFKWTKGADSIASSRSPAARWPAGPTVPAEYRSLHRYLLERYADTVVLKFAEIEDLLGFVLPDSARLQTSWWAGATGTSVPHARAWTAANRTATPNLSARTVAFERATA